MISEVDIYNMALTILGAARITSIDDNVKNAREIKAIYAMVRDETLRAHPWRFAKTRFKMPQNATAPVFGYTYAYGPVPADCLRVIEAFNGNSDDNYFEDWETEGQYILTNEGTLYIKYIARITDTALFTADFATTLAHNIASLISWNITNSASLGKTLIEVYMQKLKIAKSTNAQETGMPDVRGGDTFVQGRL